MKVTRFLLAVIIATLIACSGSDEDGSNGLRNSFPAKVIPIGPPPFACGPPFEGPGATTQAVMQKLNSFWESGVIACPCQADAHTAGCTNNGFVSQVGYIFYDRNFLNVLDSASQSTLPADFFIAHEFGHNIQLGLGLNPPGKFKELQADCLGGYYVGFQQKSGQVKSSDVVKTFNFACTIGDPSISPWWVQGSHGTCPERVNAVQQGVDGYFAELLPGQACPG